MLYNQLEEINLTAAQVFCKVLKSPFSQASFDVLWIVPPPQKELNEPLQNLLMCLSFLFPKQLHLNMIAQQGIILERCGVRLGDSEERRARGKVEIYRNGVMRRLTGVKKKGQ